MVSSEVQRTLVKSPPELWAELSDPASLARHLGELGEIRITRIDPEQTVEWEGEDISGTVLLKPSGWGTKVTLAVTRELPESEVRAAVEPRAGAESAASMQPAAHCTEPTAGAGPDANDAGPSADAEPTASADVQVDAEPTVQAESKATMQAQFVSTTQAPFEPTAQAEPGAPVKAEPQPAKRRRLLSKLFRRGPRKKPIEPEPHEAMETVELLDGPAEETDDEWTPERHELPATETEPASAPEGAAPEKQPDAIAAAPSGAPEKTAVHLDEPASSAGADPPSSAGADPPSSDTELRATEEVAAEQVEAVLTAVLDRLGAAHHRPFSRG